MTIRTFDRPTLRNVTDQFMSELKGLADKLGVDIESGGGTYGGLTGVIKINLSVRDTGAGKSGEQGVFETYAAMHGIALDAFGKTFVFDKRKPWETYEVCKAFPSSPKYRFGAKSADGRVFKFTPELLREHFPA